MSEYDFQTPKGKRVLLQYLIYSLGVITTVLLWYVSTVDTQSSLHRFNPILTLSALSDLLASSSLWDGVIQSLKRLFGGLAIAIGLGVPTGLLIGYFLRAHQFTYIPFQFLRFISPLSWTPVAIIIFGIGSGPVYFLVAIAAIWPVIINTAAGVRSIEPQWIDAVRCMGGKHLQIIRYVLLRATLPSILVGIQLALGIAWIVLVPAEMLGVASGLGYMILDFRDVNDYASIMALIIVIGFLGLVTDLPLRKLIKSVDWK